MLQKNISIRSSEGVKMKKLYFFLFLLLFSCKSSKPCDVYLGTWADQYNEFTVTTNGENYLVTFKPSNYTHGFQSAGVCENGSLNYENGLSSLTYIEDGGYILLRNSKYYRK